MCGILGAVFAETETGQYAKAHMHTALAAIAHRGPNDRGLETTSLGAVDVILGHTRLSIIDLSAAGHQPMHSACGQFSIVFNGEVYNYRELRQQLCQLGRVFRTDSDTEVLLAAWQQWGFDALQKLRGMFAFSVLDRLANKLFCARDAFGIKPFYYSRQAHQFLFASELPALLALFPERPSVNVQRSFDYLIHGGYDDSDHTFLNGIIALPAGHFLELDLNDLASAKQPERWWWPKVEQSFSGTFESAADELRERFLNSIRLHLRSDVPIGAALSGGVDSSAVVCGMRHVEPDMPINTFSYIAKGQEGDEEVWADMVNQQVRAKAHKITVSGHELAADIDDMIRVQGEPFYSTSIYAQYRVFKLARENGVTVTLDGQGADELLAGYNGYPGHRLRSLVQQGQLLQAYRFANAWAQWPGRSKAFAWQSLLGQYLPAHARATALKWIGRDTSPAWLNSHYLSQAGVQRSLYPHSVASDEAPRGRYLTATLRRSLSGGALGSLLRHGDRNSMRWAVESRVPFLNSDIAEFLLTVPEHFLVSNQGETKSIFRHAMRGIVPDPVLDRKDKVGFATPELVWLRQLGQQRVYEWLEGARQLPMLNVDACRSELKQIIDGQRPFSYRAWRLINLCRWVQVFNL